MHGDSFGLGEWVESDNGGPLPSLQDVGGANCDTLDLPAKRRAACTTDACVEWETTTAVLAGSIAPGVGVTNERCRSVCASATAVDRRNDVPAERHRRGWRMTNMQGGERARRLVIPNPAAGVSSPLKRPPRSNARLPTRP
jgi:hypothetical protein